MLVLIFIITFVASILSITLLSKTLDAFFLENQILEVLWTLMPVFILLYIGAPSLYVLYRIDYDFLWNKKESRFFVKVSGHQWYWSYRVSSLSGRSLPTAIERYMTPVESDYEFFLRLLDVDNRLSVPCEVLIKFYVTSIDVLHSWALPSAGIKMDACPGRLNQITSYFNHPGVIYGQCSEICGANHSFMPIVLECRELQSHLNQFYILNL